MTKPLRALCGVWLLALPLSAATVTVNDSGDSTNSCATTGTGTCTLRDAITYANTHAGSTIDFGISGGGVHSIAPASAYPPLTAAVTIDGFSQPGSAANSNGPGLPDNSTHLIEIDGTAGAFSTAGLQFNAGSDGSLVKGLVINRGHLAGIAILGVANITVEGCFLGTDPTGTSNPGGQTYGVLVDNNATSARIGGTTPAARNLISGASGDGVGFGSNFAAGGTTHHVEGNFIGTDASGKLAIPNHNGVSLTYATTDSTIGGTISTTRNVISGNTNRGVLISNSVGAANITGNLIEGNFIGTDLTGTLPLGNGFYGIDSAAHGNTLGGSTAGAGNVIAANNYGGIHCDQTAGVVIQGNHIGTDASGLLDLGNNGPGITLNTDDATIGGISAGEPNVIAFNGQASTPLGSGVFIVSGTGDTIRGNSFYSNGRIAIDLSVAAAPDGPTPNDTGDVDSGANGLQNFPLISTVINGPNTTVTGLLHSTANTTFQLDFYSNPSCSPFPRDFLQAETYLGSSQVTTDGSGNASFNVTTLDTTSAGARVNATATDPSGSTSELSQRLPFSVNLRSGPPAGGTGITISGTNFVDPTVTIGGVPATGVNVVDDKTLNATTPALAAGTANDIVVANTDGTNGTLPKGWIADFTDVPGNNGFYFYVTTLVSNGITAGIGSGLYGVNDNTLRQQMAVFLLKAKHGLCYTPPPCAGVFTDVPCPSTFAPWIEAMAAEGITGGCGGSNFCPQNPVRRDQMAVFLLKAEHGSTYTPPTCVGTFPDVPCPSPFANWIEQLAAENVTGGCGGGNYCPLNPNTRGQMAAFITKTFKLQ